jgi:Tol biopolymer transport system component
VAVDGGIATLVAPDGTHIGYSALVSKPPESLTGATDLADRSPAFSPDGTTLLFGRVLVVAPDRSAGIWLSGLDGRDLRQLSTDGTDARWLP